MRIYPSLDLMSGSYVRLKQGNFNEVTTYGSDPVAKAKEYAQAGAKWIHVVDLDGSRTGDSINEAVLETIAKESGLFMQTGGGVRRLSDIERKLKLGASRVVIGTAAVNNPAFAAQAIKEFGDAVAIGIDAKNGIAAAHGWTDVGSVNAVELAKQMADIGVKTIIYTDIAKDGMMSGVNVEATAEIINVVGCDVIASGGVSSIEDLREVKSIKSAGVILGKSLFIGAIDLKTAIKEFECNV